MELQKVAVVGATGYSGEELIRILMRHTGVELVAVTSRQHAGETLETVFPKFQGHRFSGLKFVHSDAKAVIDSGATFAFLALPHGLAHEFAKPLIEGGVRVIDLSADFRLKDEEVYAEFYGQRHPAPDVLRESVYGIPEIYREQIKTAKLVASAGCYPTSIILPLFPLLKQRLLDPKSIIITSMSGVSGAGRKVEMEYLFVECNESMRAYAVPKHRHLPEVEQELSAAAGEEIVVSFAPHLIPVNRGMCTTIHAQPRPDITAKEITDTLMDAYKDEIFVRLQGESRFADTKNVTHTNFIDIAWRHDPRTGRVVLLSAIDNLIKGASGQAVQSFNLMCGWPEMVAL